MDRVDFLIAGAQKCGTTALHAYLSDHAEINMGDRKELHYFDTEDFFASGEPDYEQYHSKFSEWPGQRLRGEATPAYLFWPPAPQRIARYNPDMKLVVLLRNPVDRAYSHWNMQTARGVEQLTFREAVLAEPERCHPPLTNRYRRFSYVDRGYYSRQIERLWECFPRKNVYIERSDELRQRPNEVLERVCRFLNVSPMGPVGPRADHEREYDEPMRVDDRLLVGSMFADEIERLSELLGRDFSDWATV